MSATSVWIRLVLSRGLLSRQTREIHQRLKSQMFRAIITNRRSSPKLILVLCERRHRLLMECRVYACRLTAREMCAHTDAAHLLLISLFLCASIKKTKRWRIHFQQQPPTPLLSSYFYLFTQFKQTHTVCAARTRNFIQFLALTPRFKGKQDSNPPEKFQYAAALSPSCGACTGTHCLDTK